MDANDNTERTARLNGGLHMIDEAVREASTKPEEQCGMLFLAHVLAVRRFMEANNITDRGRRMKLLKTIVAEFEKKLRTHVRPDANAEDILSTAGTMHEPEEPTRFRERRACDSAIEEQTGWKLGEALPEGTIKEPKPIRDYICPRPGPPCPNCGEEGAHFAPPSFGEPGFYTCIPGRGPNEEDAPGNDEAS